MQHVLCDADLLQILLAGIRVIAVYQNCRILKLRLVIGFLQIPQILIMIICVASSVIVDIAAENGMCHRISCRHNLPATVQEGLTVLCRRNGIHHDRDIPARRVLHTDRDSDSACHHAVLLILHRTSSDGHIGKKIRKIAVILRIEHFLCAGKAGLLHHMRVHLTNGDDACQHILAFFRIRLMEHSLIADALGPWLVRIDSRNDENLILDLLLHLHKAGHIFQHRILAVGRARPDDKKKAIILSIENILDDPVAFLLHLPYPG